MTRSWRPLAVALLSASTLAYEILLVRAFAIEQFYHFAYMAIGVAMLGFGASGTLLALARPARARAERWFTWAAVATPLALVASTTLVHRVPLEATQLPWDPAQWPRLALVYLLLALPFATGALAILVGLTLEAGRVGRIYGASFLGAGLGAAAAVAVLWLLFPVRALAFPAFLASLGGVSAAAGAGRGRTPAFMAVATVVIAMAALARPPWRLRMTPFKALPQVEAYPGARRVAERTSPLGWVVAVDAPAFRYAPGLSLAYAGSFPRQTALLVDGQLAGAANSWGQSDSGRAILDWLPSAAPYALGGRNDVLVLGAGAGTEVWNALSHGARRVTAVELNPNLVELAGWRTGPAARRASRNAVTRRAGAGGGAAPGPAAVEWVIGDARSFVARSDRRFDLITLGAGFPFGTSAAGVHALNEDFLHTVDAYEGYLRHLSEEGVLAVTRWLTVPPRESVRAVLTVAAAMRRVAPGTVALGLVVLRSWATVTVLAKPSGFSRSQLEALAAWATERGFDLDWHPGIEGPAARFNLLDEPTLYRAARAAVEGPEEAARFASRYAFDVAARNDARPYPHHFLRASALGSLLRRERGAWLPFAEWGYIALVATLVQSLVLAALLIVVPAGLRARAGPTVRWLRLVAYFAAIGFAYMAAEIAAVQQLHLLLGHPVYAVAAVLVVFLMCSGAGAAWSDRVEATLGWRAGAGLAVVLAIYAVALLSFVHLLQPTPLLVRGVAALTVLAPLTFAMGLPFPLGLRSIAGEDSEGVAWAWASNGFASVVAAPAAALIALGMGSRALLVAAAAAYAAAALLLVAARAAGGGGSGVAGDGGGSAAGGARARYRAPA